MLCSQVDIFSLGVIMYELFTMTPMACMVSRSGVGGEMTAYAHSVALGHREPFPRAWAPSVTARTNQSHVLLHVGERMRVVWPSLGRRVSPDRQKAQNDRVYIHLAFHTAGCGGSRAAGCFDDFEGYEGHLPRGYTRAVAACLCYGFPLQGAGDVSR